jgi:phosphatidylglycerol:prolipoprotein diacylglycerol transferase
MHLYGLIIGISSLLIYHKIHRYGFTFFIGLITSSFIGARIYHVLDYWNYYSQNPAEIIKTWQGGLGIFGAIILSLVYIFSYSKIHKVNSLTILDSITPVLPLAQAIGRIGNWVNHENPLWWLESLLNLSLFFYIRQFPKNPTAKYFTFYGLIRLVTDHFRQDIWIINQFKLSQILAIIFIIVGLYLWPKTKKLPPPPAQSKQLSGC